jgi:hypothetical protein
MWPLLCAEIRSNQGSMNRVQLPSGRHINTLQITADIPGLEDIRMNFPVGQNDEELITQVAEIEGPNDLILGT